MTAEIVCTSPSEPPATLRELRACLRDDIVANRSDASKPGVRALMVHRFGNWRMSVRPRVLRLPFSLVYKLMFKGCQWFGGICLPYTVIVGRRVKLEHFGGMILVADKIGDDVILRQNTTFGISHLADLSGRPIIGNRVQVGTGAVVIGRIWIGDDAVIGANAVVTADVPEGAVVGGVPARPLHPAVEVKRKAAS